MNDKEKIRELIQTDNITNHHLAIDLGVYTLGMTVGELLELIKWDDIEFVDHFFNHSLHKVKGFGGTYEGHNKASTLSKARRMSYQFITGYLKEKDEDIFKNNPIKSG